MGSDREARALGAGCKIEIVLDDGTKVEYMLRPVVSQHLCDLELEALDYYKRRYLKTWADNIDTLGDKGSDVMERKIEEAARWDLDDLPLKTAHDTSKVPINAKVRKWVAANYDEMPGTDTGIRALLSNALDTDALKASELSDLSGQMPRKARVRYDQWWVTASMHGMISFILSSLKRDHPSVTRADVQSWSFYKIAEAARLVESRTVADSKNG